MKKELKGVNTMAKFNSISTYDREMKDQKRKDLFEEKYARFLLSEIVLGLMQQEKLSVRALARSMNVSPTLVQDLRSGKRKSITLKNFLKLASSLGAAVNLEKNGKVYRLLH